MDPHVPFNNYYFNEKVNLFSCFIFTKFDSRKLFVINYFFLFANKFFKFKIIPKGLQYIFIYIQDLTDEAIKSM